MAQRRHDPSKLSDRQLLILLYEDVEDIKTKLGGNGQPGMSDRLTVVETRLDERTSKAKPVAYGGLGLIAYIAAEWLRAKFGIQF